MTNKKKPLVLVVEDEMNSQMLMNYYLRDSYEVDFCISVTEANKKLKSQRTDIILLDLSIIATTAHAFTSDRNNCITVCCDDYMSKPKK